MSVDIAAAGLNYKMSKISTADEPSLVYTLGLQHHFCKETKQNKTKRSLLFYHRIRYQLRQEGSSGDHLVQAPDQSRVSDNRLRRDMSSCI